MPPKAHRLVIVVRRLRQLAVALVCAALLAATVVLAWARQVAVAESAARFALDSDEAVVISRDETVSFRPRDADPVTGIMFYPGGKAEPAAYAPILRNLAARGFLVVMIPMPLNLALLAPERAGKVMPRFPEIQKWVLAGHSLGGVMAAEYVDRHPGQLAGLVLLAAYPANFSDLSGQSLPVLLIAGSADVLTTPADIDEARHRLPPTTSYLEVAGGDHWNFGNFAPGQATATISREEQQANVLDAMQAFLDAVASVTTP